MLCPRRWLRLLLKLRTANFTNGFDSVTMGHIRTMKMMTAPTTSSHPPRDCLVLRWIRPVSVCPPLGLVMRLLCLMLQAHNLVVAHSTNRRLERRRAFRSVGRLVRPPTHLLHLVPFVLRAFRVFIPRRSLILPAQLSHLVGKSRD